MMLCSKQIDEYLENQHNRTVCHTCVLKTVNRNMERGGSEIYIDFTRLYRARLRDYRTVQRYENNRTNHLPASPIAQVKNPQRSPLRLRFLTCTLEEAFCVIDSVIFERYTWSERRRSEKSIQISDPAAPHIPSPKKSPQKYFIEKHEKMLTIKTSHSILTKSVRETDEKNTWGLSSAGRASALQAEGHRFEPYRPHIF